MKIKYIATALVSLALTACVETTATDYVKDNGVHVHKEEQQSFQKISFNSGCYNVTSEITSGGLRQIRITERSLNPERCWNDPQREEVNNLLFLLQRYRTPCTTLDENGNPAYYEGNSPEVIKTCHERGNPKDIGACLLQGAPKEWSVDCK